MNFPHGNLFRTIEATSNSYGNPAILKLVVAETLAAATKAAVLTSNQINSLLAIWTRPPTDGRTAHEFQPSVRVSLWHFVALEHGCVGD